MKLIDNARVAWRFASIQISVLGAAVQGAAFAFHDFRDWLGDELTHVAGAAMFLGAIAGRLVSQDKTKP